MTKNITPKKVVINVPYVYYPAGFQLWKKDVPTKDKINFINPEDFHIKEVYEGLGIANSSLLDSLGITDTEEIEARQELVSWLMADKKRRNVIHQAEIDLELPSKQSGFLSYYNPGDKHCAYWQQVHKIFDLLSQSDVLPKRLQELLTVMIDGLQLEKTEKVMSEQVIKQLESMMVAEGVVTCRVPLNRFHSVDNFYSTDFEIKTSEVVGHYKYSAAVEQYSYSCPSWMSAIKLGWFYDLVRGDELEEKYGLTFEGMKYNYLPYELKSDILSGLTKKILALTANKKIWDMFDRDMIIDFHVRFRYDEDGYLCCYMVLMSLVDIDIAVIVFLVKERISIMKLLR